jgi:hypothetical protein
LDVSSGGDFILRNDTDYLIQNQTVNGSHVRLRGGRKVVVMGVTVVIDMNWADILNSSELNTTGFELQVNPYPETDSRSGGAPQAGREFYVEGCLVTGPTATQGFRINAAGYDVTIVNCHVDRLRFANSDHRGNSTTKRAGIYTTNHPDIIQMYNNACASLTVDGLSGYSMYQGFFFRAETATPSAPILLRRVDLHAFEEAGAIPEHDGLEGVLFAGHRMLNNYDSFPLTVESDVWVEGIQTTDGALLQGRFSTSDSMTQIQIAM